MSNREPKVFIVIGGRGSGKTYFLEKHLDPDKTIVLELAKTNRWNGFHKEFYEDFEQHKVSFKDVCNKKIVFEDATSYMNGNLKNSLKQLIVFSKQLGCDVFIILHSVNIIPPFLWNLWNYIILFKCAKPKLSASNADYYDEILQKWKHVCSSKKYTYEEIQSQL